MSRKSLTFIRLNFVLDKDIPSGYYHTYFINCMANPTVTFDITLTNYNIDSNGNRNYLGAGEEPLPIFYGCMTGVYFICLLIWLWVVFRKGYSRICYHFLTVKKQCKSHPPLNECACVTENSIFDV